MEAGGSFTLEAPSQKLKARAPTVFLNRPSSLSTCDGKYLLEVLPFLLNTIAELTPAKIGEQLCIN